MLQQKNNIVVSSIAEYLMNLFLGGINGDIHIVKKTALYFEKDGIADNINKSRLCQAKSYVGHVSFVNQIEIDSKELSKELCLYTTGINDQAIFQWSIQIAELYWDMRRTICDASERLAIRSSSEICVQHAASGVSRAATCDGFVTQRGRTFFPP